MSVLSRHRTVPSQRAPERVPGLEATPTVAPPRPVQQEHRVAVLIAGGAVIVTAVVGTAAYLVDDGAGPATAPSTTVDAPMTTEAERDAALARRNSEIGTSTDARRDAALARRNSTP